MPMKMKAPGAGKKVLIIGGTRFSGLYLWKELHDRVRTCPPSLPLSLPPALAPTIKVKRFAEK